MPTAKRVSQSALWSRASCGRQWRERRSSPRLSFNDPKRHVVSELVWDCIDDRWHEFAFVPDEERYSAPNEPKALQGPEQARLRAVPALFVWTVEFCGHGAQLRTGIALSASSAVLTYVVVLFALIFTDTCGPTPRTNRMTKRVEHVIASVGELLEAALPTPSSTTTRSCTSTLRSQRPASASTTARQSRASEPLFQAVLSGLGRTNVRATRSAGIRSTIRDWLEQAACPRQESNLRARFRKPLLYPLSYGGADRT
jgi:hypothetical protein